MGGGAGLPPSAEGVDVGEFEEVRRQWEAAARALAERFKGKVAMIEIFNEPNLLHEEAENYMDWERSVDLYISAARAIKEVDPRSCAASRLGDGRVGEESSFKARRGGAFGLPLIPHLHHACFVE